MSPASGGRAPRPAGPRAGKGERAGRRPAGGRCRQRAGAERPGPQGRERTRVTDRLASLAAELEAAVPGGVARDVPAAELGTYRVGGPLAVLVRVPDDAALARVGALVARAAPA